MDINFHKVAPGIFIADVNFTYEPSFCPERPRNVTVRLRVDGRGSIGGAGWRVDNNNFGFWEAIDGGYAFLTLADAMAYADRWVGACIEQGTLTPNTKSIPRG